MVALAAALSVASACKPAWSITLDGGTAAAPEFSLARRGRFEPARIAAFRVDACLARGSPPIDTHWLTVAPGAAAEPLSRIVFGAPPAGWRSAQGPHPLTPGCYRAAVADAPPLEFDVHADGRVTARR